MSTKRLNEHRERAAPPPDRRRAPPDVGRGAGAERRARRGRGAAEAEPSPQRSTTGAADVRSKAVDIDLYAHPFNSGAN